MSFKRYGTRQIGDWVDEATCSSQNTFTAWTANDPEFEPASVPPMSAVCIRFSNRELTARASKMFHAEVARRIEQSGRFWISTTELKGKTWFRINPVTFLTRLNHMDELFALLQQECHAVLAEGACRRGGVTEWLLEAEGLLLVFVPLPCCRTPG